MLQVYFFSANIYLFGMMKGRSTLIVKANTISSKAAYVNTAAAWWWMSCKWCQHLFLTMMRDTQPQWSNKHSDTLVHISPITLVCAGVLVAFSLSRSLFSLITSIFVHPFRTSQSARSYVYSDISGVYMGLCVSHTGQSWVTRSPRWLASAIPYQNNPIWNTTVLSLSLMLIEILRPFN